MKKLYILNEYYKREFHSNLLLAVEAASKNYEVYLGTMDHYKGLINKNLIKPGIFHTKSVTHDIKKSNLNKLLKKKGFKLTIHDQEHGILENDYKSFCRTRISKNDLKYFDAFFCWGKFDYYFLRKNFKIYEKKFYLTGSPRVDLWKNNEKISKDKINFKKKYILIITNFSTSNNLITFKKVLEKASKAGYYKRYPNALIEDLNFHKYQKKLMNEYIKMIKKLSHKYPKKEIIIRPHPTENAKFWEVKFLNYKNVFVHHDGLLSSLISKAELIIQSGCTSSIESFIGKKKIINYLPVDKNQKIGAFVKKISKNIFNLNDLILFIENPKSTALLKGKNDLNNRTLYLENKYAVKEIVKIYSKFTQINSEKNSDFNIFFQINFIDRIKYLLKYFVFVLLSKKRIINIIEHKYFNLSNREIEGSIEIFKKILKIKKKIRFKKFSDKFIKIYLN